MTSSLEHDPSPPPPVIDVARVIAYAAVDDMAWQSRELLVVDGKPLEQVQRLAIGIALGDDTNILLFHCDEAWNVLGAAGAASVDDARSRAARNYPGVAARWVELDTTVEQALAYHDAHDGARCSFCGRRSFEIDAWIARDKATICSGCVQAFHERFDSFRDARSKV